MSLSTRSSSIRLKTGYSHGELLFHPRPIAEADETASVTSTASLICVCLYISYLAAGWFMRFAGNHDARKSSLHRHSFHHKQTSVQVPADPSPY